MTVTVKCPNCDDRHVPSREERETGKIRMCFNCTMRRGLE